MTRRLFVNLGNTALQWALEQAGQWAASGRLGWREAGRVWRASTQVKTGNVVHSAQLDAVIACVSSADKAAAFEAKAPLPVRVLGRDFRGGIAVQYRDPRQIGADRLASATAAAKLHPLPAIVVSAGTCLTCEVISAEGELVGGAIAPGLPVYTKGLLAATPHLPTEQLDPTTLLEAAAAPGQTTLDNLATGVALSLSCAADAMARAMQASLGADAVTLLLTGGDAPLVERHSSLRWIVEPLLTIEGLRIIHDGG